MTLVDHEDYVADSEEEFDRTDDNEALTNQATLSESVGSIQPPVADPQHVDVTSNQAVNDAHDAAINENQESASSNEVHPTDDGNQSHEPKEVEQIKVGSFVMVDSRTWPGINKLGGAGRVTKVHTEQMTEAGQLMEKRFYDVRYVMGGFERRIEEEYVKLSHLLERPPPSRPPKPRQFYHEEFGIDKNPKKRVVSFMDHEIPPQAVKQPPKKQQRTEQQSDGERLQSTMEIEESRSIESNDDDDDDEVIVRKTGGTFKFVAGQAEQMVDTTDQDDDDDELYVPPESTATVHENAELPQDDTRADSTNVQPSKPKRTKSTSKTTKLNKRDKEHRHKSTRVRKARTRPRQFVGGYHIFDDGSFIQPEYNEMDLPDDVRKAINFSLGSTKEEMKAQLKEQSAFFEEQLIEFENRKRQLDARITDELVASSEQLDSIYNAACDLNTFLKEQVIRRGEDIVDMIMRTLERKHARLDELFAIQHDNRKGRVAENGTWIKNVLSQLQSTFLRIGRDIPTIAAVAEDEESELSSSDDDDDGGAQATSEVDVDPTNSFDSSDSPFHYNDAQPAQRRQKSTQGRKRDSVKRPYRVPHTAKPAHQHRKSLATSTTLEDYGYMAYDRDDNERHDDFIPSYPRVRVARGNRALPKEEERWNWKALGQKKQAIRHRVQRGNRMPLDRNRHAARHEKKQPDHAVLAKVRRLRDQRFRGPSVRQNAPTAMSIPPTAPTAMARVARSDPADKIKLSSSSKVSVPKQQQQLRPRKQEDKDPDPSKDAQLNWSAVFEVSTNARSWTNYHDLRSSDVRKQLLSFGRWIRDADDHQVCSNQQCHVEIAAQSLMQTLSDLRLHESLFFEMIGKNHVEEEFVDDVEWKQLEALGAQYHELLFQTTTHMLQALKQSPAAMRVQVLRSLLEIICMVLSMLPDCASLFVECAEYTYFFEVAAQDACSTPVLSAIAQSYWFFIQLILQLKVVVDRDEQRSALNAVMMQVLAPNRVILSAVLFLVDLYMYYAPSHRLQTDTDSVTAVKSPALSLWLLIYDSFANSGSKAQQEKDFWILLKVAYEQHFIDHLAASWANTTSCGGYLCKKPPKASKRDNQSQVDYVSQFLALECTWDIAVMLAHLCGNGTTNSSSERWQLIICLLQPRGNELMPFGIPDLEQQNTRVYSAIHQDRVLERLLLLSVVWEPCNDIVAIALKQYWNRLTDDNKTLEISTLPSLFDELQDQTPSSEFVATIARGADDESYDAIELLCRILAVHLAKLEKPVLRNRFRQPVLRLIADLKATKDQTNAATPSSTNSSLNQKPTNANSWNWGGTTSNKPNANAIIKNEPVQENAQKPAQTEQETRLMVSVVSTFALIAMAFHQRGDNISRTSKPLQRELEFYCKEAIALANNSCPVLLADFLCRVGMLSMSKMNGYSQVFVQINTVLENCVERLKAQKNNMKDQQVKMSQADRLKVQKGEVNVELVLWRMHDLTTALVHRANQSTDAAEEQTIRECIAHVLNVGLGSCLDAAVDALIDVKLLNLVLTIVRMLYPLPKCTTLRCVAAVNEFKQRTMPPEPSVVVDEFGDDDDFLSAMMEVDLDALSTRGSTNLLPTTSKGIKHFAEFVRQHICERLRSPWRQLVLNYPQDGLVSYEELYAIELFGEAISTTSFPFVWNDQSLTSHKSRLLAPRLLSAALKFHSEKEWFTTRFLRDASSDQELALLWLMATLDTKALLPDQCAPMALPSSSVTSPDSARYADYWIALTDGIIMQALRENSVAKYKMDANVLRVFQETAINCKFPDHCQSLDSLSTPELFQLHLGVFRSFCQSVGHIWTQLNDNPSLHRDAMYRFRSKMLDTTKGAFVAITELYEINLQSVRDDLETIGLEKKLNWYAVMAGFARDFTLPRSDRSNFHAFDESIALIGRNLTFECTRKLIVVFKFMYDCVDAFLFHCGSMAIGQRSVFFAVMELMFRQAWSAEYAQARARLTQAHRTTPLSLSTPFSSQELASQERKHTNKKNVTQYEQACAQFIETVRLFFACQKYPSLVHWFAQTVDTYRTLGDGWSTSPLRVLLLNILDPDGPLGIQSYYPDDGCAGHVRREAYYLSCGLLVCKCTSSYQHCVHALPPPVADHVHQLRRFILQDFMADTFAYAGAQSERVFEETIMPILQLLRAYLHHCNANMDAATMTSTTSFLADASDVLESVTAYILSRFDGSSTHMLSNSRRSVLLLEFSRITKEALELYERDICSTVSWLEMAIVYFQTLYSLMRQHTPTLDRVFADASINPSLPDPKALVASWIASIMNRGPLCRYFPAPQTSQTDDDEYGISPSRVHGDLLLMIRQLARTAQSSSLEGARRWINSQ